MTRVEVVEPCPTKWRAAHNTCPDQDSRNGWHECYRLWHEAGVHLCECGAQMGNDGQLFMTQPIPQIQRERFVPALWVRLVLAACVLLGTGAGVALVLLLS